MTESDQVSKSSNQNGDNAYESKEGYRTYMIGTRILKRNYTTDDIINYDSDPFGNDITVSHKQTGSIIAIDRKDNEIVIKNNTNSKVISYKLSKISIELESHDSDNDNIDGILTFKQQQNKLKKITTEADIDGMITRNDTTIIKHTAIAMQKEQYNNSEKRKQERKHEESYARLVQSIDNDSQPRITHDELLYRPYKYLSTAVTRPNMKSNPNGKGILYTEYNENEHEFYYFRYWIGRSDIFRDSAELITNDLKEVILRDEYDLENIREDMMLEDSDNINDDSIESMILNETEFEKYQWNHLKQNKLRLIVCETIDILPFYIQWIKELETYKSINDLIPTVEIECPNLPCPALKRLLIVSKFYKRWIKQNFNEHLEPKQKFHFSVHDFMDCLEHYNSVEFQNDYQHLQHCHIEPINAATKVHHGDAFGLNVGTVQNPYSDDEEEDDDDDDDGYDDEKKEDNNNKKKEDKYKVILDSENRNIYEWFEDLLGECDPEKCAIFERTYRSRYDSGFENQSDKYYVLNDKERNDWLERVSEVQYQRIFDGMHTILFHSSARFDCMGLGNSEEHRKFVMLSTDKRKEIKAKSKPHHRGMTMPNKALFK